MVNTTIISIYFAKYVIQTFVFTANKVLSNVEMTQIEFTQLLICQNFKS